ncbi:MAG: SpoIIE family protein phosphatase [Armatimonadota bacterium]
MDTCSKVHFSFHVVSPPDYKLLMINNAQVGALKSAGISDPLKEFIGKRHWDIFPDWENVILPMYQEVCKTGEARQYRNIRLETPSRITYWDSSIVPHTDAQSGKVISISVLSLEVTEQKRIEQEIAEAKDSAEQAAEREAQARATLQVILDTVPVGVVMGDAATGKITYFSPGAVDILGGPLASNVTEAISESYRLLKAEDRSLLPVEDMPIYRSLLRGERMMNMEVLVERSDGNEVTALANSAPVLNSEGNITGAVVSLTDISEMVELRRTLETQLTQLERALIPTQPSIGQSCTVSTAYVPASARREVTGDFYDAFTTADGKAALLIGDVSGKGIEAASLAAATRSTIRALAYHNSSPSTAMTQANSVLYSQQPWLGAFVTVFLAIWDPTTGDLAYTNAGHPPGITFRHRTSEVEIMEVPGLVVGVKEYYQYPEFHSKLYPNDKLLLYTDGISEAWPGYGEFFGSEGIAKVVRKHGHESSDKLVERLLTAARDWADGELRDDTAVVAMQCILR